MARRYRERAELGDSIPHHSGTGSEADYSPTRIKDSSMAKSRVTTHPWDHDHSEEGLQTVNENETLHDALMDNASQLSKKMKLSDTFWSLLVQRGVVDERVKAKIQETKTKRTQAMALVQHVLTVEVYKLHGFVWALVNSNQCHMAELLGLAVDDYLDMEVFMMSSAFRCPACTEFYTKAYILTGCGHYICAPCGKGAQSICKDNKKEDITCPVPECGKTTEASPSEESLGLEEDVAFKDLCDMFVQKFFENREYAKNESEKAELEDKKIDEVKVLIENLKKKVISLEKFRKNLEEQEATLKDHVREEQDKISRFANDWGQKNLKAYAGIEHQVDKKLHQSLHWEKAASELSVLLSTQPWLSEIELLLKDVLTKEADSPIPTETLMEHLHSGHSILTIVTPYELKDTSEADGYGGQQCLAESVPRPVTPDLEPAPPTQAKFQVESKLKATKLAWTPDGELLVLTSEGLYQLDFLTLTSVRKSITIITQTGLQDVDFSSNATLVLTQPNKEGTEQGVVKVCERNAGQIRDIELDIQPNRIFINNSHIYILAQGSRRVHRFNLKCEYQRCYNIGLSYLPPITGYIHVTEKNTLLVSSPVEDKIYRIDLKTNTSSHFGRSGEAGQLSSPQGVCSVNNGEHVLVCDTDKNRVCVFSHDGTYLHDLVIEKGSLKPTCIAVLARAGQPTLLALGMNFSSTTRDQMGYSHPCQIQATRVYTLE